MHAELAYLFRHTLHCDAAYQLQMPGQRARLHALALRIIESVLNIRAPEPTHDPATDAPYIRDPCDTYASELAYHAEQAAVVLPYTSLKETRRKQACYLFRAAEHANAEYQHEDAARHWGQLADMPELEPQRQSEALRRAAGALDTAGRGTESLEYAERAVKISRAQGDNRALLCAALSRAGLTHVRLGHVDRARACFDESLAAAQSLAQPARLAQCLRNIANLQIAGGELELAETNAREALAHAIAGGDLRTQAILRGNIGTLLLETGRLEEAQPLIQDAIRQGEALGDRGLQAQMRGNLGSLFDSKGDVEAARTEYVRSLEIARSCGDRRVEAVGLGNIATLLQNAHKNEEASELFHRALEINQEMGHRADEGLCLGNLGTCDLDLGKHAQALEYFVKALDIAREVNEPRLIGVWLCYLGCAYTLLGKRRLAGQNWNRGARQLKEMEDPYFLPVLTRQYNRYRGRMGLEPVPEDR